MKRLLTFLMIFSLLLSSCGSNPEAVPDPNDTAPSDDTQPPLPDDSANPDSETETAGGNVEAENRRSPAEKHLAEMSLRDKIGQLFIIRPDSLEPSLRPEQVSDPDRYGMTGATDGMLSTLEEYPAGGIAFFGKNLSDSASLAFYLDALNSSSAVPLLYAVDEEGGVVSRIANSYLFDVENIGFMEDIGATEDPNNAYSAGRYIGGYLSSLGFNLDFAPVADINTNPNNIVIGSRAFGSDPALVSSMVGSFLNGLHEEGVIGCTKHFPGHGDTSSDTHDGFVSVYKTWEKLQEAELIPFTDNFETTDLLMIAHLTLPNITCDGLPASLSRELITDKLKNELGYNGLVITDALDMGAITKNYSSAEAAVLAIEAGADILLLPFDYQEAFDGLYSAVQSGRITESRLDESVLKILELKLQYGIIS